MEKEKGILRQLLPHNNIICLPYFCLPKKHFAGKSFKKDIISFIGHSNEWNKAGIKILIDEILPIIKKVKPSVECRIYGEISTHLKGTSCGVKKIGHVSAVEKVYREAKLIINPVPWGTGQKIKIIEALAYGKAVISMSPGIEHADNTNRKVLVYVNDTKIFAEQVVKLLEDDYARHSIERNARRFIEYNYNQDKVYSEFFNLIEKPSAI
jgi:glycosyltransferase involved in cell wall biosynthesis